MMHRVGFPCASVVRIEPQQSLGAWRNPGRPMCIPGLRILLNLGDAHGPCPSHHSLVPGDRCAGPLYATLKRNSLAAPIRNGSMANYASVTPLVVKPPANAGDDYLEQIVVPALVAL